MVISRIFMVTVLFGVICNTVLASDPIFNSPVDYSVGTSPVSICGADFDGDGYNDLAVVNYGDSSVSVLINEGDGTFQPAVKYTVGNLPVDIVASDFVGSSDIDLAIVSKTPDVVSILIGNGDGTFQSEVHPVGNAHSGPTAICAGDFEGDGDNDLAVSCWGEAVCYYIYDLLGDTIFHTFDVNFTYPGYNPYDVVSADFNGDNTDDLAVMDYIATDIYTFKSGPIFGWFSGSYWDRINSGGTDQIFCADVNGDSKIDIIGAVGGVNGGYGIFLGNGDCSFGTGSFTSIGPMYTLYVADFDDDSDPDIALTGPSIDSVFIVMNDGNGSFSSASAFYAGGNGDFIYGIELNGDNYNDLVVAHSALNTVSVLINGLYTDVEDNNSASLPETFWLSCNYPNPFNPVTTIEYGLPRRSHVTIEIYNILGRTVRSLVDREESAGWYAITWDGMNDDGESVATGIYLYRLKAGDYIETKRMLLLK